MALIISTWLWGNKYSDEYVERLRRGVEKHHPKRYTWRVFRPEPEDEYLTQIPGCLCRLRMFDRQWQDRQGLSKGDRLVTMDLDSIVTGSFEYLFITDERFMILKGANTVNKCPFNGSLMMLKVGSYPEVWNRFSLDAVSRVPHHDYPDDQAWIWHMMPNSSGWVAGFSSGVYAFKKHGWPPGDGLPPNARLVVFPGWRDPQMFIHLPWVKKHWDNDHGCKTQDSINPRSAETHPESSKSEG